MDLPDLREVYWTEDYPSVKEDLKRLRSCQVTDEPGATITVPASYAAVDEVLKDAHTYRVYETAEDALKAS